MYRFTFIKGKIISQVVVVEKREGDDYCCFVCFGVLRGEKRTISKGQSWHSKEENIKKLGRKYYKAFKIMCKGAIVKKASMF